MSPSMRTKSLGTVLLLCLATTLAGCSKKDEKKDSAKKSAKTEQQDDTTATAAAPKLTEADIPDEEIPTEEDYEAQVEQQIKAESNLPAELDKIEKEIGN